MSFSLRRSLLTFTPALLLAQPAAAFFSPHDEGYYAFRAGVGVGWIAPDDTHIGVTATETDKIKFDDETETLWTFGLGYHFPIRDGHQDEISYFSGAAVSLDATYLFPTDFTGDVYMYSDPMFNNLTHTTQIEYLSTMLNLSVDVVRQQDVYFFVTGGIGAAWTWVEYQDMPKPNTPQDAGIKLKCETNTTFAWQVGAGLGYNFIKDKADVTLTYLYTDLGEVETSNNLEYAGGDMDYMISSAKFDLTQQSLMLAMNIRFN